MEPLAWGILGPQVGQAYTIPGMGRKGGNGRNGGHGEGRISGYIEPVAGGRMGDPDMAELEIHGFLPFWRMGDMYRDCCMGGGRFQGIPEIEASGWV